MSDVKATVSKIGLFFAWLWGEISRAYESAKKFVVNVLQVFKAPPVINAGGTVVAANKTSAKRVWASVLFVVFVRQLFLGDKWGALMALGAGLVLLIIAAVTKT